MMNIENGAEIATATATETATAAMNRDATNTAAAELEPPEERPLNTSRKHSDTAAHKESNGSKAGQMLGLGLKIAESEADGRERAVNGRHEINGQRSEKGEEEEEEKDSININENGMPELGSSDPMALPDDHGANGTSTSAGADAGRDSDRAATASSQRTTVQMAGYTTALEERQALNIPQRRDRSLSPGRDNYRDKDGVLRLSAAKIQELTSSPESLCLRPASPSEREREKRDRSRTIALPASDSPLFFLPEDDRVDVNGIMGSGRARNGNGSPKKRRKSGGGGKVIHLDGPPEFLELNSPTPSGRKRQNKPRTVSTPGSSEQQPSAVAAERQVHTWSRSKNDRRNLPNRLPLETIKGGQTPSAEHPPSPTPMSIPLPPFSIPTYLQLELSSESPSPLYIHQSAANDFPYESSRVKLERLLNFLLVPIQLEQVLCFGTLACLDSWLHSFTILPLRFGKSIFILLKSWAINLSVEAQEIFSFIVKGVGRVWRRKRSGSIERNNVKLAPSPVNGNTTLDRDSKDVPENGRRRRHSTVRQHRRTKSIPSALMPDDKADILKGLLMIFTCLILMRFDASRVYHWIRGQAAIKLYVIYNVLEVRLTLVARDARNCADCF